MGHWCGENIGHGVWESPEFVAGLVGEPKVGFGEFVGVTVGPVGVEIRVGVERAIFHMRGLPDGPGWWLLLVM